MSSIRAMPCIALVLPILALTGAVSQEKRVDTCDASSDTVSFVQLSQRVKQGSHKAQKSKPDPDVIQFEAGYPEQRVQVYLANYTSSLTTLVTTTAAEPVTTAAWTPPPLAVLPVTVPPGQVKVSVYMENNFAVSSTTTSTTTLTMKIEILIGGNKIAAANAAPPQSALPAPSAAVNAQATSAPSTASQSNAMNIQRQASSASGGGQPGTFGYASMKKVIPPTPGRSGEIADINNEAEQVLGGAATPAPPPPYLSPHAVNEHDRANLGLKSSRVHSSTTEAPSDVVHPLNSTQLTSAQRKNRTEAAMDCELSDWNDWSMCDTLAGDIVASSQATRSREMIQPPQPGGKACGVLTESRVCSH